MNLHFKEEQYGWGEVANSADELLALAVVTTISYVMNAKEDDTPTNHL